MKLDRLETHDRFQYFTKQQFNINETCQKICSDRPFGNHPFYIFAHARTADDGITKRLIWQPRLTKPKAQTNSMLFKVYPGTDMIKVIWMIPARELWNQYRYGNITQNQTIFDSIIDFQYNRKALERKEDDDLNDDQIDQIYKELSIEAKRKKDQKDEIRLDFEEGHSVSLE